VRVSHQQCLPNQSTVAFSVKRITYLHQDKHELTKESCEFRTLGSWLQQASLTEAALLKVDVQWAEYLVLDGAQHSFDKRRFKTVLIELINGQTYEGQKPISHYYRYFE